MIEIITTEQITIMQFELVIWSCWLQITQDTESWILPTTAPGELAEDELQAYFEIHEIMLWRIAQEKQYPVDLFTCIPLDQLLRAFALVILDEINILRIQASLPERTAGQIITAIKAKL